jgi:nucleotidyltransferase substrate binding protein (TIGR01987 family)
VDRLRQRLSVAGQAAATLRELAVRIAPSKIKRDAAIHRIKCSFEATWKAAQRFLAVVEGVEAGSPKSAIRACHEAGLLQSAQAEQALTMADDRNLTAHTYDEGLAGAIFQRLPGHLVTLEAWLRAMRNRMPAKS